MMAVKLSCWIRTFTLMLAITGGIWFTSSLNAKPPYLTGMVEDSKSQTIEMPALPFTFQRQIEWLAPEGSFVEAGMPVVRIEAGNLLEQVEMREAALSEQIAAAALSRAQNRLEIIDAEIALAEAQTAVRLATLDSEIPASAVTQLNSDKAQLALESAENLHERAQVSLASATRKTAEQEPILQKRISNAEIEFNRVRNAINQLEILAEQSGVVIYGENEITAQKINVGESVTPGQTIATVSRQENLQFGFWVHDVDVLLVQEGQNWVVSADALPDLSIVARISFVSNHATERTEWGQGGYYKVVATPTTPPPAEFLPGLAISAEMQ